jgi:hypothetical protein
LALLSSLANADDWVIASGKGTVTPDKVFSDPETVNSRGIDWGPWTALEAVQQPEATPTAGKKFVSPDQRFSAQTTITDRECNVVIKNLKTGSVSQLHYATFPVLALAWCPDSKTILTVVHEPMSSFITVLHWDGNAWVQFKIGPPYGEDNDKYHVVDWAVKPKYIQATYIVNHREASGKSLGLHRCTFNLDPLSGKISDAMKTEITEKEYISLRGYGN